MNLSDMHTGFRNANPIITVDAEPVVPAESSPVGVWSVIPGINIRECAFRAGLASCALTTALTVAALSPITAVVSYSSDRLLEVGGSLRDFAAATVRQCVPEMLGGQSRKIEAEHNAEEPGNTTTLASPDTTPLSRLSILTRIVMAGASLLGITAGMIANYAQHQSLLSYDMSACWAFDTIPILGSMNAFRDSHYSRELNPLFPIWLIPISLIYVLRRLGSAIPAQEGADTYLGRIKKAGWDLKEAVLIPTLEHMVKFFLACVGRKLLSPPLESSGINLSGHIFNIGLYLTFADKIVDKFSNRIPEAAKFLAMVFGALSLTEFFWTYNTAANCHSVMDVGTAVLLVSAALVTSQYIVRQGA